MTFRLDLSGLVITTKAMQDGAEKGVKLAVEHLLSQANLHVPHDEGTLERSGQATAEGLTGAVSYDTPYAVRQHEDLQLHHQGKGQAKWLETTLAEEADKVRDIISAAIRPGGVG